MSPLLFVLSTLASPALAQSGPAPKSDGGDAKESLDDTLDGIIAIAAGGIHAVPTGNLTPAQRNAELRKRCDGECISGVGTLTFDDGTTWKGPWVEGVPNGKGTLSSNDGAYVGEVKNGVWHGQGKLSRPDGSWYEGGWSDGKQHGAGKEKTPDGLLIDGTYANNMVAGKAVVTLPDGVVIDGTFTAEGPTRATIRYPNGESWTGGFDRWSPHGWGTARDPAGNTGEIRFENGKPVEQR